VKSEFIHHRDTENTEKAQRISLCSLCLCGESFSALALTLVLATHVFAQSVAYTPRGVLIAHDNVIELAGRWKTEGVSAPGAIAVSETRAAVLDTIHDRVAIVDLMNGRTTFARTEASPVAAAFAGNDLLVVDRDARVIEKIGGGTIPLGRDPEFLSVAGNRAYVYSRVDGTLQEISIEPFALRRTLAIPPFASAMQCDSRSAYLVYPRDGKVRVVDLATFQPASDIRIGAVPTDIAFTGAATALSAPRLAIADPSAKRVWLIEGRQSTLQAFGRGFLRGIFGLGLFGGKESQFATGVDRVVSRGSQWLAFDSSSGTLYKVTQKGTTILARGLAPHAFTLTPEGVAYWQSGTLVAQKLSR
jgi:hypothetical protein